MKLSAIVSALNARLESGSVNTEISDTEITGLNGIEQAGAAEITFVANPRYAAAARLTKAAAVIVAEDFPVIPAATLRVEDPYLSFARALELFHQPLRSSPGIHPTAIIHPTAKIGAHAHIGPYVVVDENVVIGAHAVLLAHVVIYRGVKIADNFFAHSHVVVREGCRIGNNVLLHNGVVIGSDGFGFAKAPNGRWHKIPQPAPVVIEDDVEVQANSCIDRASVGETRIRRGAKVDNLVQVGHGSQVGEDALLCSQVGLGGSTEIGNRVILTGQVGVVGHCKVGEATIVTPQSGVANDVPAGALVSGAPAVDHKLWLKY
jgi:UDP-3-O-[3-hydroxymyristoyl] glucosamine N-acyltransferase